MPARGLLPLTELLLRACCGCPVRGVISRPQSQANKEDCPMANHLTPTELAREAGLERREVITKCVELGVPIFQGRIDKTLFLANIGHVTQQTQTRTVTA